MLIDSCSQMIDNLQAQVANRQQCGDGTEEHSAEGFCSRAIERTVMKTAKFRIRKDKIECKSKRNSRTRNPDAVALTASEEELLKRYEEILRRGLGTFFEVGNALLAIRAGELYRGSFSTFEEYCNERWGIGRTYAWRVIGAAERLRLLPAGDDTPRPSSEFQMRPFLKVKPEEFPTVWKRVMERAQERPITSALIGGLVDELLGNPRRRNAKTSLEKGVNLPHGAIGEVLVLIDQVKRHIKLEQLEKAKAELERIERVISKAFELPPHK